MIFTDKEIDFFKKLKKYQSFYPQIEVDYEPEDDSTSELPFILEKVYECIEKEKSPEEIDPSFYSEKLNTENDKAYDFYNESASNKNQRLLFQHYKTQILNIKQLMEKSEELMNDINDLYTNEEVKQSKDIYANSKESQTKLKQYKSLDDFITNQLLYFQDFSEFSYKIQTNDCNIKSKYFSDTMDKLDSCIAFISKHLYYKEAQTHLIKYKTIQGKALSHLRDYIISHFRTLGDKYVAEQKVYNAKIQKSLEEAITKRLEKAKETGQSVEEAINIDVSQYENLEDQMSLLYMQFHSDIQPLCSVIHEIEKRGHIPEYKIFLQDAFEAYQSLRLKMIYPVLEKQINQILKGDFVLENLSRGGASLFMQSCLQEYQIYSHLFQLNLVKSDFRKLQEIVCSILYEGFRMIIVSENNLSTLSQAVSILHNEIIPIIPGSSIENTAASSAELEEDGDHNDTKLINDRAEAFVPFDMVLRKIIKDIQERVIFRSSIYITEHIQNFNPKPEDLQYPEKLEDLFNIVVKQNQDYDDSVSQISSVGTANTEMTFIKNSNFGKLYDKFWYPTLSRTLNIISILYEVLSKPVFEGLAQESLTHCMNSFIRASIKIDERSNTSVVDAELFLIVHLLALRLELNTFDTFEFITKEVSVDFSHIGEGIRRFLRGHSSFSMRSLVFDIMSQSQPRIIHSEIDSKQNIENKIKEVHAEFVLNVTRLCFDDLMVYLKKIQSYYLSNQEHANPTNEKMDEVKKELLDLFKERIEPNLSSTLSELSPKLMIYVQYPQTRNELYDGVKQALLNVWNQLLSFIDAYFKNSPQNYESLIKLIWSKESLSNILEASAPKNITSLE